MAFLWILEKEKTFNLILIGKYKYDFFENFYSVYTRMYKNTSKEIFRAKVL